MRPPSSRLRPAEGKSVLLAALLSACVSGDAPAGGPDDAPDSTTIGETDGAGETSAGTRTVFDLDACAETSRAAEGGGIDYRCPGIEGIPLFVHDGDGRWDLDAGAPNEPFESPGPFNEIGDTLEWLGPAGARAGVVYVVESVASEVPDLAWLVVEKVGTEAAPGCEVMRVDRARPDAWERARSRGARLARDFRCGGDRLREAHPTGSWIATGPPGRMAVFGDPDTDGRLALGCGADGAGVRLSRVARAPASRPSLRIAVDGVATVLDATYDEASLPTVAAASPPGAEWLERLSSGRFLAVAVEGEREALTVAVEPPLLEVVRACRAGAGSPPPG